MTKITALKKLKHGIFIVAELLSTDTHTAMCALVAEGYAKLEDGDFSISRKGIRELTRLEKAQRTAYYD